MNADGLLFITSQSIRLQEQSTKGKNPQLSICTNILFHIFHLISTATKK
jgi:hypothetical protein